MSHALLAALEARLAARAADGLARTLEAPPPRADAIDLSSNDYLGLAREPVSIAGDVEARPASRLLGGTTRGALALEARLAAWKGHAAGLLFPSGFQANLALLSALVGPEDRVLSDAANHASLIDGLRLARPAVKHVFPHLDVDAVRHALETPHPGGRTFLVTESLFSMDGDLAPLEAYAAIARAHDVALIVDEAHAAGLYGARASGRVEALGLEREVFATVTTFGKSFAAQGAVVTGARVLVDWLASSARGFVYSTALASPLVALLDARLERVLADPTRGARAIALAGRLRARLRAAGLDVRGADSPIVPLVLGAPTRAVSWSRALARQGFDVRAVRPPTVPDGASRLRISVHADHDPSTLDALAAAIEALA
jgi:8-amino-7-oxononanoate synthase